MRSLRPGHVFLAAILILALPTAVSAQDEPGTLEGVEWHLTAFDDGGALSAVPLGVEATLLLESGQSSGSGGCNSFSGSYQLDGVSLTFAEEVAVTLRACEGDAQLVEGAYLPALPQVSTWDIVDGSLQLADDFGAVILAFEQGTGALTTGQLTSILGTLSSLQDQIDALGDKVENHNVRQLRKRIKDLEAEVRTLRTQVNSQPPRATARPPSTAYSSAEKVLLEGVATRIRNTCVPLRTQLPHGTVAAVQCKPNTVNVRDMAYYLLSDEDAFAIFNQRMSQNNVPDLGQRCSDGSATVTHWVGGGPAAEGCYVDSNGRASLRFLEFATDCRVLHVDGRQLRTPTIYIAVIGHDRNIAKVADWATNNGTARPTTLTQPIKRPNAAPSPACPV